MATAIEIYEKHPDVVAVFGDFMGPTVKYSAQVYSLFQLPFCASSVISQDVLDRNKHPYYFETTSVIGYAQALHQLLTLWSVKRIGVISSLMDSCPEVVDSLSSLGIQIAAHVRGVSYHDAKFVADTLEQVDVRYILYCGQSSMMANMYLTLGARTLQSLLHGVIMFWGQNFPTTDMEKSKDQVLRQIRQFQAPWGTWRYSLGSYFNFMTSYDCTGLIAKGFDKMLQSNKMFSAQMLANRTLQKYLNPYSIFENGDPLTLTVNGDTAAPFTFFYFQGSKALNLVYFGSTNANQSQFQYAEYSIDSNGALVSDNQMTFLGGSHTPPPDGPIYQIDSIDPESATAFIIKIFASLGILLVLLSCWFLATNRLNPIIRTGSVPFLTLMSLGSLLGYGSLFFALSREETLVSCAARSWLQLLSFAIVIGCLIVKNGRVYLVYKAKKKLPKYILRDSSLFLGLAVIVGFEAGFLGLQAASSRRKILKSIVNQDMIQYKCVSGARTVAATATEYVLWAYNCLLLLLLISVGYAARNVGPQHNELTIMALVSVSVTIGAVLMSVLERESTSHTQTTISSCIIVWIMTSLPLFLSLIPRFIQYQFQLSTV
ncbi:hypothetical protein BDR26DRAFT_863702 [Obelidium mucronatum]|nr:hypothetical protein BDR26DRAFT_863702 [Obelidium mucronatum]